MEEIIRLKAEAKSELEKLGEDLNNESLRR